MNIRKGWRWINELFSARKMEFDKNSFVDLSMLLPSPKSSVIYVGSEGNESIEFFIHKNLEKISQFFKEAGCEFIFHPAMKNEKSDTVRKELTSDLSYFLPNWSGVEYEFANQIIDIDSSVFYRGICQSYNLKKINPPLFLRISEGYIDNFNIAPYPINCKKQQIDKELSEVISNMLYPSKERYRPDPSIPISLYDPSIIKGQLKYDADIAFNEEASRISREVALQIQMLIRMGQNKALLNIYNILINQTKLHSPELGKKFNELNSVIKTPISRIVVDTHHRILLPDFKNLEIKMTPLPKTLYLLFLQHPDGLMLHDLVDYRKELYSIYGRITNSSCTYEIRKRINDMTDMSNNSVNEKCSRIKEAFIKNMDDSIAKNYYITGERGKVKRIHLQKNLRIL